MYSYNVYCDESCHLPHDNSDIMVIGGVVCPKDKANIINQQIKHIKKKHHIYEYAEIKWTKVSDSRYEMFRDLLHLFFDTAYLRFQCVVAQSKHTISQGKTQLSFDDWYQRIYYLMLKEVIRVDSEYYVYVDIKDSKGAEKINQLRSALNHATAYFYDETVKNIQLVQSGQINLMQLSDLLVGAVGYANRRLDGSPAKHTLIEEIQMQTGRKITNTTPTTEDKFNVFLWKPKETEDDMQ